MALDTFSNNASTLLNGGIDNDDTTVVVDAHSSFPQSGRFRIVIDDEIMLVTSGAGTTTWTVTRAQESTTGVSHSDNATITHVLTANVATRFVQVDPTANSAIVGGVTNTNSVANSVTLGGDSNTVSLGSGAGSVVAFGRYVNATFTGSLNYSSGSNNGSPAAGAGDAQAISVVLRAVTTNASATEMFVNTSERLVVPADGAWCFTAHVIGKNISTNETSGYIRAGVIERNGSTTAIVGSITSIHSAADGSTAISVTADDTNESLLIQVTGVLYNTYWWVARVDLVQVIA